MKPTIIAALLVLAASHAAADDRSLTVGGMTRSYRIHLPNGQRPSRPVPLVVVLHGGGGNAENAARMSDMDAKADREGFVAVYPNGTGATRGAQMLTWNAWVCCGAALENRVDDVRFVRALVEAVAREHPIDSRRVYATGLSNGAMMAYRLACEASDVFAAVAPVAGALNTDDCRPKDPVSVVIFHGRDDRNVRYDGGKPLRQFDHHERVDKPVPFALTFWSRHNRCPSEPRIRLKGNVIHTAYECEGGTAVELYAIGRQGHAWPGGRKGLRHGNVDEPTREISATDLMWDFFARHPKR